MKWWRERCSEARVVYKRLLPTERRGAARRSVTAITDISRQLGNHNPLVPCSPGSPSRSFCVESVCTTITTLSLSLSLSLCVCVCVCV
ncbi:hypothetical protein E2C01_075319 [Portunus trituberculatus]|uniref:Uncharacterized protein n=1 Tax=Portunus trituberculatus TaxID=210409 RepID=A0A5B7I5T1_PORTR|nr:hypothetical protein [Portunus trituberculatus]